MSKITDRIAAQSGVPRLAEILAELPGCDLQSLLLEVFQARARNAKIGSATPLTAPSSVDARKLNDFDRAAFAAASNFEAIELSPVAPFGLSHLLGGIDQNNVVTTIRNAEVLGDSTEPLALECARRRKLDRNKEVRLAASHRVIRMQPFDTPGFTPHFRLFALASAGRDTGSSDFEARHLAEHIRVYLDLCRDWNPRVEITDLRMTEAALAERGVSRDDVRRAVRAHWFGSSEKFLKSRGIDLPAVDHPMTRRVAETIGCEVRYDGSRLEGLGYYSSFALRISIQAPDGNRYPVIDGGFTDWTARLLSDRKEKLLTSGLGSEFFCRLIAAKNL